MNTDENNINYNKRAPNENIKMIYAQKKNVYSTEH